MMKKTTAATWMLSVMLFGCGGGGTGTTPTDATSAILALQGDATKGKTIYSRNCASCHGDSGKITGNAAGEAKTNPRNAVTVILNGEYSMPAFSKTLTQQDIADVLAHLKTL